MNEHHDIAIIGSGPAGFTAGIYTGRANLSTLIFEYRQNLNQILGPSSPLIYLINQFYCNELQLARYKMYNHPE
jgi:thioredoxin reductase